MPAHSHAVVGTASPSKEGDLMHNVMQRRLEEEAGRTVARTERAMQRLMPWCPLLVGPRQEE